jgi:hypothetical protein
MPEYCSHVNYGFGYYHQPEPCTNLAVDGEYCDIHLDNTDDNFDRDLKLAKEMMVEERYAA